MAELILASASPRRAELLRNAGISFIVQAAEIDESRRTGESPIDYACRLALAKASAVFAKRSTDFVLGADTIVTAGEEVLGKPRDAQDAIRMLKLLSGRKHLVTTGVCLMAPHVSGLKFQVSSDHSEARKSKPETSFEDVRHETTKVFFNPVTEEDIRWYVQTGEPMDKAGAYAIQGGASRWVSKIVGCYFNVVGLPVPLVYRMLKARKVL